MTNNQYRNKPKRDMMQLMSTLAYTLFHFPMDEQSEKLGGMKREINDSNKQKQEVLAYCHLAIALAGTINHKISYLKGLMDQFFKEYTLNQIKTSTSSPILIFVIYDKSDSNGKVG